ncbi:cytochrome P450 [Epithele typhae]|uniref:cytochrome P450 n=1 Tax=Epithele typhae TaxID=378194 RepID=UPI00200740FE|nr:cytochrome P450 [Epithele typhae]KAH9925046.1 cytochrome P450 [Epithele typhae]
MALSLLVAVTVSCVLYIVWGIIRHYFLKLAIDALPGPPSDSLLLGNVLRMRAGQGWQDLQSYADTYGRAYVAPYLFGRRHAVISDPKALHYVMIKEQDIWQKDIDSSLDNTFALGPSVLFTAGEQHKRQRKLLNPVFSVAHLRGMMDIFYRVAHQLDRAMDAHLPSGGGELDVSTWMGRGTLEMLGQAGLGYSFDDFTASAADELGDCMKRLFATASQIPLLFFAQYELRKYLSHASIRALFRCLPHKGFRDFMKITDTIRRRSDEIIRARQEALTKDDDALKQEVGEGKDIISVCLKANMAAAEDEKMSQEELVAQISTFMLAGMDTTSNSLARVLQLLAEHPEAQDKLRAEAFEAQGVDRADLPYDVLERLPYLDAVCRETLRLFAPVPLSSRTATKDTVLPFLEPIALRDGRRVTALAVERGTTVTAHYSGPNVDRALWGADALQWTPERWLDRLPKAVEDARIPGVYAHLTTFAAGAYSCIGFKFSQLEMKVMLSILITHYKFETTGRPIEWNMGGVIFPSMAEDRSKPGLVLKLTVLKA